MFDVCIVCTVLCYHREELIDVAMERSVARMQSVIELARVIRDRKVIPVKVGGGHVTSM